MQGRSSASAGMQWIVADDDSVELCTLCLVCGSLVVLPFALLSLSDLFLTPHTHLRLNRTTTPLISHIELLKETSFLPPQTYHSTPKLKMSDMQTIELQQPRSTNEQMVAEPTPQIQQRDVRFFQTHCTSSIREIHPLTQRRTPPPTSRPRNHVSECAAVESSSICKRPPLISVSSPKEEKKKDN